MRIGERILLLLFTFITILFAFVIMLIPLNVFDINTIKVIIEEFMNSPYYAFIPFIVILLGVGVLFIGFKMKNTRFGIIHANELGKLIISPKSFESAGYNVLKDIKGIKDAKVEINFDDSGIEYYVDISVINDLNVPDLTLEIQTAIKKHVENLIGIPVKSVNIHIKDLIAPQASITHVR